MCHIDELSPLCTRQRRVMTDTYCCKKPTVLLQVQDKQTQAADFRAAGDAAAAGTAEAEIEECNRKLVELVKLKAQHVTEQESMCRVAAMCAATAERADQEAMLVDEAKKCLHVRIV